MRILITAGPTREYIDAVRFLSNGSTGRMGYACARAAARRGHEVTLVSGPVQLRSPKGVTTVNVTSAAEMAREVGRYYEDCDAVIMTAAVCDYRPRRRAKNKQAKTKSMNVEFVATQDILAGLGRRKGKKLLVGFAVQDRRGKERAQEKLERKNLDAIVLNPPSAMAARGGDVSVLARGGIWRDYPGISKTRLAGMLVRRLEAWRVKDGRDD